MDVWRILRACALRESRTLRAVPVADWPNVSSDARLHVALCRAHGRYVPVAAGPGCNIGRTA